MTLAATTSSAQPTAAHRPGLVRVVLPDVYLELETDSGVFSPGRLDPGTRLLLEAAPRRRPTATCWTSAAATARSPACWPPRSPGATVWAVDVNERALGLCARNARQAGLRNVRIATPDDPAVPGALRRDLVQPADPDRQGGRCTTCSAAGSPGSRPGGQASLVMGRNLGADSLHSWLEQKAGP